MQTTYLGELFLMAVGALFLSLNVAPTEEMIVIAYKMTHWHALVLMMLSIALMHGFVYAVSFEGGHELSPIRRGGMPSCASPCPASSLRCRSASMSCGASSGSTTPRPSIS